MRSRLAAVSGAIILASGVALATLTGPAGAEPTVPADPSAPGDRAAAVGAESRADQAEAALAEVREIFAGTPAGSARTAVSQHGREATLALRDLAVLKGALSGADRAAADAFLARPTQGSRDPFGDGYTVPRRQMKYRCGLHVCVHFVKTSIDAVPLKDTSPDNGTPDYVEFALKTLESVHTTYTTAGYKSPKKDWTSKPHRGPNGKTDIYLVDIGNQSLYGYCTTDDPAAFTNPISSFDVSAYCVLDNDYKKAQYPTNTPRENFKVTGAHEYFHAVQYAYDVLEDAWFMEASATWAEDEVYDAVNDNLLYLKHGQLGRPLTPLDKFTANEPFPGNLFHYGNWIFLRYLTETFPTEQGRLPVLIRDVWNYVDAADPDPGPDPDMYAIQAIETALTDRGTNFGDVYALFADAGRRRDSFEEGVANTYPLKPLAGTKTLSAAAPGTSASSVLDHMTNATWRIVPHSSLTGSAWVLDLAFNLDNLDRGSEAVVTVYPQVGAPEVTPVTLDATGAGQLQVDFGLNNVKYVEVTLVNASTTFSNCFVNSTPYSCSGKPTYENRSAVVNALAKETT